MHAFHFSLKMGIIRMFEHQPKQLWRVPYNLATRQKNTLLSLYCIKLDYIEALSCSDRATSAFTWQNDRYK